MGVKYHSFRDYVTGSSLRGEVTEGEEGFRLLELKSEPQKEDELLLGVSVPEDRESSEAATGVLGVLSGCVRTPPRTGFATRRAAFARTLSTSWR